MDAEIDGRKLGTSFDFPLQWGSRKKLRGPKLVNGSMGLDVSGLFRKAMTVGGPATRADNQFFRQRKQSQSHSTNSHCPDFHKVPKRFFDVSSDPCERTSEPVESNVVDRVATTAHSLRNELDEAGVCFTRAGGMWLAGNCPQECTPVSGGRGQNQENMDLMALPKFLITLSRKEKEEDFWAIKGSRLPPRPKKRAKHIQRLLHGISPGSWLCDLTLDRYDVSEKRSINKRPQGLKAMGGFDSDSD